MFALNGTEKFGFVTDRMGAHRGRTIMVAELKLLLSTCDVNTGLVGYRKAIIDDNVLQKRTMSNRRETYRRLRQLYGLDNSILVFRVMRELWDQGTSGRNLLACLCALTRDPLLRCTVHLVVNTQEGYSIKTTDFEKTVADVFPGHFGQKTLASIGRNLASSWVQSGHLRGTGAMRVRQRVTADWRACVYALFLAYLTGHRRDGLFDSTWIILLDTPIKQLRTLARRASELGWFEYRNYDQVTEIAFRRFLENSTL